MSTLGVVITIMEMNEWKNRSKQLLLPVNAPMNKKKKRNE